LFGVLADIETGEEAEAIPPRDVADGKESEEVFAFYWFPSNRNYKVFFS